ncbi:MAG: hypothetical protein ACI8RD_012214, partial [Bacillariaceae sp.]
NNKIFEEFLGSIFSQIAFYLSSTGTSSISY